MPVKSYYTATARQTLRQIHEAAELMTEYARRLADIGVEVKGDEIITTSDEQSELVARTFRELCQERGLRAPKEE